MDNLTEQECEYITHDVSVAKEAIAQLKAKGQESTFRRENVIMKITKESWLKATASAMSTDEAKELFKSDSEIESLFTQYAFHLYIKLKDKTLTKSEYHEIVAKIHTELITELGADTTNIIVNIALIIFAVQIWENLTDQIAQDEFNSEYDSFKSVLKSQKSE